MNESAEENSFGLLLRGEALESATAETSPHSRKGIMARKRILMESKVSRCVFEKICHREEEERKKIVLDCVKCVYSGLPTTAIPQPQPRRECDAR